MKNLILGIALVGLAVGCKNNENNQVSDASTVEAPAGETADCPEGMCDAEAKAECEGMSGCDMSGGGCDMKASEEKVCPMTGEVKE